MPNFLSVWHKGILAYGQSPAIIVVVVRIVAVVVVVVVVVAIS